MALSLVLLLISVRQTGGITVFYAVLAFVILIGGSLAALQFLRRGDD